MYKQLLNGLALALLLSACRGVTPRITAVCDTDAVGNDTVKWETKPAIDGLVKVFASTNPDHIPETFPVAIANIADLYLRVVNDTPAHRRYYTLLFDDRFRIKVAARRINVPGTQNFRDLGGYPVYASHKRVRWGMLYRSAQLDTSRPATLQALRDLGIRTIIDLRETSERDSSATLPPDSNALPRVLHIPIHAGSMNRLLDGIHHNAIHSDTVYRIVERVNRHIVSRHASEIHQIFTALLDRRNYPAVIQCNTGKGRTGIASALVLTTLGVDDESILYDYRLSNRFFSIPAAASYAYALPVSSQEALTTIYSARENFLNAAKDEIERRYGSVDSYLRHAVGLTKDEIRQLQAILLEEE